MKKKPQNPSTPPTGAPQAEDLRIQLELVLAVRRIMHAFDLHSRRLGVSSQITLPQLLCLWVVAAKEGLTSRQIAEEIHVSASTLVGVLDRLESKGLVTRVRDPRDRRQVHIVPTAAGRAFATTVPSPFGDAFDDGFGALAPASQKRLTDDLALMADLMTAGHQEPIRQEGKARP